MNIDNPKPGQSLEAGTDDFRPLESLWATVCDQIPDALKQKLKDREFSDHIEKNGRVLMYKEDGEVI